MQQKNRLLSVFMSFVLVCTIFGVPAYADETPSGSEDPIGQSPQVFEDVSDVPLLDDAEQDDSADTVEGEATEKADEAPIAEDEAVQEPTAEDADQASTDKDADAVQVAASEVIGFVYLDESVIALGQEQNIAVGLVDENALIDSARLDLVRKDTNEVIEIDALACAEGAALFAKTFENEADAVSYQLVGIRYEVDGAAFYAHLTQTDEGVSYTFDVVTQEVADSLSEAVEKDNGEVSAFAVKDDGTLVATDSVQEAIMVADAEGVQSVEAAESVVDEEALAQGITGEEDQEEYAEEASSDNVLDDFMTNVFGVQEAWAAKTSAREDYLIVALDPGHGGGDTGATGYVWSEDSVNWSIASHCYNELNTYTGVTACITRGQYEYVGLQARVNRAVAMGSDVFVSLHCNSGGGMGAEVWVPNSSSWNYGTHVEGAALGEKILSKLSALGLVDRGVKVRNSERVNGEGPFYYPDGSIQDYYSVIESSREVGMPGIIVEHAFVDNASDAAKLNQDSFRQQLGVADATGIASEYSLVKAATAQAQSLVKTTAHVANVGWLSPVYDQKVAGTTGKSFGLEAFQTRLQNAAASAGGITYRSYVGKSWQGWVSNGATSGTTGQGTPLQAVQIKLTGAAANQYDVYYRVHVANVGWLGWAKNGQSAGSSGYGFAAEGVEIALVAKGAAAPGDTTTPYKSSSTSSTSSTSNKITYQAHVAQVGWQSAVSPNKVAGTTGRGLPIEALIVKLSNPKESGTIQYNLHCADIGWQGWKNSGQVGGTTGQSRQTEAIQIRLTDKMAEAYDIYYRVHSAEFGWLDWAKNGQVAGTEGYGYSMQAIQIQLVAKNGAAPGATANHSYKALVGYSAHVAEVGWQSSAFDGAAAGTTGRGLRLEALQVALPTQAYAGGIQVRAHVSSIGWQNWTSGVAGTTGRSLSIEALQIRLTGEMANNYDVYYRVHSKNYGWLGWAKNGASAGTTGKGLRAEAVQIVLVNKNGNAPGSTGNPFYGVQATNLTSIMGSSTTTVDQMVARFGRSGATYPSSTYAKYGASTIQQFCTILKEEAEAEGVRADVVFAQTMVETGWLRFGGDVKADQCNFAGLGATGGVPGNSFNSNGSNSVRIGLRAQVQHLKCYASTSALKNSRVDPRWSEGLRNKAPYVEWLSIPNNPYGTGWAAAPDYASSLKKVMVSL